MATDLGTIFASIDLKTAPFASGVEKIVGLIRDVTTAAKQLNEIRIDEGILKGAAGIERSLSGVITSTQEASAELRKMGAAGVVAGDGLKVAGSAATSTGGKLEKLSGTSTTAAKELTDVGAAGDLAAEGLEAAAAGGAALVSSLSGLGKGGGFGAVAAGADKAAASMKVATDAADLLAPALTSVGAAAAAGVTPLLEFADAATIVRKALSSVNRVATGVRTNIGLLSTAVFDPAGIVAGANEATAALSGTRRAANGVIVATGRAGRRTAAGAAEGSALGRAGRGALGVGTAAAVGITGLAALGFAESSKFDTDTQQILGNTNATPTDIANAKKSAIQGLRMGQLDTNDNTLSYMHVINHGYKDDSAQAINEFVTKMKIATGKEGGSQELIGQVVSGLMHAMGLPGTAENVSRVGNLIHQGTASGDVSVGQMAQYGMRAVGNAYRAGNSPADSIAALSSMSQSQIRAPQTATNLSGMVWQIVKPTTKAQKAIDAAGLQDYYGPNALAKYGLRTILNHSWDTLGHNQRSMQDIFGNKTGGQGAMALVSPKGQADYKSGLYDAKTGNVAAWEGRVKPVEERYAQAQKTPGQQIAQVKGTGMADAITVGQAFTADMVKLRPILINTMNAVTNLMLAFAKLPGPIQGAVLAFGGLAIVGKAIESLTGLSVLLPGVGEKLGLLRAAGTGAAAGEEAAAVGAAGLSLPLVAAVAAIALLALAWKTDFGHIREVTKSVLTEVTSFFRTEMQGLLNWYNKTLPEMKEATKVVLAAMQQFWHNHGQQIMGIVRPLWDFIKSTIDNALVVITSIIKLALDVITGNWKGVGEDLKKIVKALWDEIVSLAVNGTKVFGSTIKLLAGLVLDQASALLNAGAHIGQSMVEGIAKGIMGGAAKVKAAITTLAQHPVTVAKTVLQINSPSKVFHAIGLGIGEGLADGIRAGTPGVVAAAGVMSKAAIDVAYSKQRQAVVDKYQGQQTALTVQEHAAGVRPDAAKHAAIAEAERHELGGLTRAKVIQNVLAQAEKDRLSAAHTFANKGATKAAGFGVIAGNVSDEYSSIADAGPGKFARELARNQEEYSRVLRGVKSISGGGGRFGSILGAYGQITGNAAKSNFDANNKQIHSDMDANDLSKSDKAAKKTFGYNKQANQGDYLKYLNGQLGKETDKGSDRAQELKSEIAAVLAPSKELAAGIADAQKTLWQKAGGDMHLYFQAERDEIDVTAGQLADQGVQKADIDKWKQLKSDAIDAEEAAAKTTKSFDGMTEAFDEGKVSAAQYDQELKDLIATTNDPAIKKRLEGTERGAHDKAKAANPFNFASDSLKENAGANVVGKFWDEFMDKGLKAKNFFKSFIDDMKSMIATLLKNWTMGAIFGGSHSGGFNFGKSGAGGSGQGGIGGVLSGISSLFGGKKQAAAAGSAPGSAGDVANHFGFGGLGSGDSGAAGVTSDAAGMANAGTAIGAAGSMTGGGKGGGLGAVSSGLSMMSMFTKGGMFSKLFAKGGMQAVFGHGMAAAMPWIGGGLLLNSVLGNPLGKLFKHFHFAKGGVVPGSGFKDSVPAMLTPGERVLTRDQARSGMGNNVVMHFTHNGDIHGVEGVQQVGETLGWMIHQRLPVTSTG